MKALLAMAVLWATCLAMRADGGAILGQFDDLGLRVTVFAAPVPFRAGPLDTTVLVQQAADNAPLENAEADFVLQKLSGPSADRARLPAWCSASDVSGRVTASSGHAKNKLLRGAYLALPESGRWALTVFVRQADVQISKTFLLDVLPSPDPLTVWWPLIGLVPAAIALYAWWSVLSRRKNR